jgi:copper chaperone CopZ
VDTLLREMEGVQEVEVDIDEGSATLSYDASRTSVEQIRQGVIDGMFNVTGVVELE